MYFPEPVFDAYSGLQVLTPGCVALDGFHALQVVRARHLQYKGPGVTTPYPADWPFENQSDLARIRRDHEFLRVLATAVAKHGLSNPITDEQLVSCVAPQLEVDKQFSTSDMVNLVLDFHSVNANSAPQLTLPVQVDQFGSYQLRGRLYGDIEFPSIVQDGQVIDQFLGVGPDDRHHDRPEAPRPVGGDRVGAQRLRRHRSGRRHRRRTRRRSASTCWAWATRRRSAPRPRPSSTSPQVGHRPGGGPGGGPVAVRVGDHRPRARPPTAPR